MCYNVDFRSSNLDHIARYIGVERARKIEELRLAGGTAISGFSHPLLPVLIMQLPHEPLASFGPSPFAQGLAAGFGSWGLVPSWIRDPAKAATHRKHTLNARSEGLESTASFRNLLSAHRCGVICSGFYETRHEDDGSRHRYRLSRTDGDCMLFGGLWYPWEGVPSLSIVTMEARGIMRWVHNSALRQPLMLDPGDLAEWIGGDWKSLLASKADKEPALSCEPGNDREKDFRQAELF